ncbi:integral membrane protein [Astrocystis sublimbata]|nr:integral membrane protein [Astrocystis sublimbata]
MRGLATRVASIVPPLSHHAESSARSRRPRPRGAAAPSLLVNIALLLLVYSVAPLVSAVRIRPQNCIGDDVIFSNKKFQNNTTQDQLQLQFIPLYADVVFQPDQDQYQLLVTVWGNVTGRVERTAIPPWGDPEWDDPKSVRALNGKIQNTIESGKVFNATTLRSTVDVLNYRPYHHNAYFCESLQNASCPVGPVFNKTYFNFTDDPYGLPSFNLSKRFDSSYAFASFVPKMTIIYGDTAGTTIGCVSATVTPSLESVAWAPKYLPLVVLLLVGIGAIFAAILSPFGTSDVFFWTSNYGRDPDLIRLVTPGFGDCLNYIQFVVLTGGLSLNYPGFYQPVVSQGAWSILMFSQQFASKAEPWQSVVDGIHHTDSKYGLERIAQLNGLGGVEDVWVGATVWLLVIIAGVLVLTQAGFLVRWLWRTLNNDSEEDLRSKNIPFSLGNVIRITYNFFLVPIVAFSTFQLVVQSRVPGYVVALAVVMLAIVVGSAIWFIHVIVSTKPRAHLSDDLPTALLYGPLYNTYKDEAAWFALVPIILNILRGAIIGGAQPSGVTQAILLTICEIVQGIIVLFLRPFHSSTWMNAYHVCLSTFRLITTVLMVPFASSLGISEGSKGWIGYAILFIHGSVVFSAFFLNAIVTIFEVVARLNGAGGDTVHGQTRGGIVKIFNARQLKKRGDRAAGPSRLSQLSTAGMLAAAENSSRRGYGRVRSESAGSMGIMMGAQRNSSAMDMHSIDVHSTLMGSSTFAATPREASTFSFPASPGQATRLPSDTDPFYRAPRARRGTNEEGGPSSPHKRHESVSSMDATNRRLSQVGGDTDNDVLVSGRAPLAPNLYAPVFAPRADYSIREADFYYNTRGPALNSEAPGRRLITGPSDPTSPVATATGWMMRLFGGKTKDKAKGFEVVRSARMPASMKARGGDFSDEAPPEGIPVKLGVLRSGPIDSDDDEETPKQQKTEHARGDSSGGGLLNTTSEPESDGELGASKPSKDPPLLPELKIGGVFQVPSRVHSKASRHPSQKTTKSLPGGDPEVTEVPEVPRKSSKRQSYLAASSTGRLPFDRSESQERRSNEELSHQSTSGRSSLDDADERPASFGRVHQRNISRTEPSEGASVQERTVEVVND